MGAHRDAHDFASARLRAEAHRLLDETSREPDLDAKHELSRRATLLEHAAEMIDTVEQEFRRQD